jgi:predicted 3-demethylubiquinone-9 3-methyltransferase (glyoxalase superfamily)
MQAGTVMTVSFELDGQTFTALNGGPIFKFNEAISLQVNCETQQEVDYYWEKLTAGGDEKAQQCGWLKDKYGVSWQIVPAIMNEIFSGPETEKSERAMNAMLQMKKIDIKAITGICRLAAGAAKPRARMPATHLPRKHDDAENNGGWKTCSRG